MFSLRFFDDEMKENKVLTVFQKEEKKNLQIYTIHLKQIDINFSKRFQLYPSDLSKRQLPIQDNEILVLFFENETNIIEKLYYTTKDAFLPTFTIPANVINIYIVTDHTLEDCQQQISYCVQKKLM